MGGTKDMTTAQEIIIKFINDTLQTSQYELHGVDQVKIFQNGKERILGINLYGDILEDGKIIAKADLPHDINLIGNRTPQTWQ